MTISGDLYITQGVGEGNVTLDNVTVKGNTFVNGGGMNSIILKNTKLEGNLVVVKIGGKVRILAEGSSEIANVLLRIGAKLEEKGITGRGFQNIEVLVLKPGEEITLAGDFDKVTVDEGGAKVTLT